MRWRRAQPAFDRRSFKTQMIALAGHKTQSSGQVQQKLQAPLLAIRQTSVKAGHIATTKTAISIGPNLVGLEMNQAGEHVLDQGRAIVPLVGWQGNGLDNKDCLNWLGLGQQKE